MPALFLLIGLALGAGAAYLVMSVRMRATRTVAAATVAATTDAHDALAHRFAALSGTALRENGEQFLQLATARLAAQRAESAGELETRKRAVEALVEPVSRQLEAVKRGLEELERSRAEAYGGLGRQLVEVSETQRRLHSETANLVSALRAPQVRGRWGEVQLRRVCELAGMLDRCDFTEQRTLGGDGEGRLRPDLVVHLPGGKDVVVDAKTPLAAYLSAAEAAGETAREAHLDAYARHVRTHVGQLSAKGYWSQFDSTPEFVVMFLPGEAFYSAALERMPDLIERSVEQSVLIATPTTLIALLKAVSYGWRQERVAESAREVARLGRDLHARLGTLADRFGVLGRRLDSAVGAYNEAIGTFEGRVLVSARRLEEHGAAAGGAALEAPPPVERAARSPQEPTLSHS